ncbi:MAG: transcriptional repressor LexA [Oscillospiraceae bacterium]
MISEKTKAVYEYIKQRIEETGVPPTMREICDDLRLGSTSTAHRHVEALIEMGLAEKSDGGKNRTVRLTGISAGRIIPVVGNVAAGQPITAIEDITEYMHFQPDRNYKGELFALVIKGESMIKCGIFDGDIVVVEKTPYVNNSEIAICMVDGEATCKRFYKEDGHYRLQPENDEMEPIITEECEILGKVVAVIRYL